MRQTKDPRSTNDFRQYLQQELMERCRHNRKYSLRAFAKSLGIAPSALSDMLNGRRTITPNSVDRLGLALNLSLPSIDRFKEAKQASSTTAIPHFEQITLDAFALISDWYHFAILELMKIQDFDGSPSWIAKKLGVTKCEANAAVERLVRLNLIGISQTGEWTDNSDGFSTNIEPGLTSAGSRKLQKQLLAKAITALDEVALDRRNNTSMTMAINPVDLPAAAEQINEFRRSLCTFLERNGKPLEIYQLAIALYPITHNLDGE